MPQGDLSEKDFENPLDILAYQYDIVCNGIELSSGAIRNHKLNLCTFSRLQDDKIK